MRQAFNLVASHAENLVSVAKSILSEPYRRHSYDHWFDRLSDSEQVECLKVWYAYRGGTTTIPATALSQRIKAAYPKIDVTHKQIAVWLRDKDADQRASEAVRKKARA